MRETGDGGHGIGDISRASGHLLRAQASSVNAHPFRTDGHGDGATQDEKPRDEEDDKHMTFF